MIVMPLLSRSTMGQVFPGAACADLQGYTAVTVARTLTVAGIISPWRRRCNRRCVGHTVLSAGESN